MWQYFIYREITRKKKYSCEDCGATLTKPETVNGKPTCPRCHSTRIKETL